MKEKEEIAEQQETSEQQIDIVNANRLDIAKQSIMVRGNEQNTGTGRKIGSAGE